jgi:hypothetical protein
LPQGKAWRVLFDAPEAIGDSQGNLPGSFAMIGRLAICFMTGAALLLTGTALVAHHAESAQFDQSKPVEVTGVVTKVEWANPHIWFYVDVKDDQGKITTWGFSGGAPGMLARRGFTKNTLKPGDVVSVRGSRARDGSNNASGGRVTFADGKAVFPGALDVAIAGGGAPPARPQ